MTSSPGPEDESQRGTPSTVFVSDPSAEAERIAQTLRVAGYVVVDVPMSMLIARVAVQRPRVILVDADADGALEAIAKLRDLPDAEGIDIVFIGKEGGVLANAEDALANEGSGFFSRPVDVPALVRKIDALTGGPRPNLEPRASTPPASLPSPRPSAASLPPASMRTPPVEHVSSRPPSAPPAASVGPRTSKQLSPPPEVSPLAASSPRRTVSIQTPLSSELEALLAEAEQRVGEQMAESVPPTPEEEIEAVLPAEILSSLDDPLEEEDDDDDHDGSGNRSSSDQRSHTTGTGTGSPRHTTHSGQKPTSDADAAQAAETHGGAHGPSTTGTRSPAGSVDTNPRGGDTGGPNMLGSDPGSRVAERNTRDGSLAHQPTEFGNQPMLAFPPPPQVVSSTLGSVALQPNANAFDAIVGQPAPANAGQARSQKAESVPPPAPMPSVFGDGEAPLVLARAIAMRATGSLCFESPDGLRRAVLREGDLLTAASGVENESLLAFLGTRGDLPRETVQSLAGKVPPFGRHAGAALIAHGHLRQDQLWPVLRAHAEWVLGRAILVPRGTAQIEADAPGRLKGEPSVFGGSTGAEVMVEVVRRVIAPDDAVQRLGGLSSRIGDGENASLLSECALDAAERDLVTRMRGNTLSELIAASPESDIASVVYGLALLGVVDVIRGAFDTRRGEPQRDAEGAANADALDQDAIRARVRARLDLVNEGDYFAVLGLSHDATGYEVRRAFLELRRAFEPSRVLTPQIADLADDVRKIANVLDEAYEILRDGARRERYRRAIDGAPAARG